jgi:hypothetical protein
MMSSEQPSRTLRRLFCGLTENTFQVQLGVVDPPLMDYLSDLLIRFLRQDALDKLRSLTGQRMRDVRVMLAEADTRIGEARREVHRHIGDYTLFWTGLYPEALRRQRGAIAGDQFVEYCSHGKRAYLIASSIETGDEATAPGEVLHRLADQFEMCAYGLREVRRELERGGGDETNRPFLIN